MLLSSIHYFRTAPTLEQQNDANNSYQEQNCFLQSTDTLNLFKKKNSKCSVTNTCQNDMMMLNNESGKSTIICSTDIFPNSCESSSGSDFNDLNPTGICSGESLRISDLQNATMSYSAENDILDYSLDTGFNYDNNTDRDNFFKVGLI